MPFLEVEATIQFRSPGAHDIEYITPSFPAVPFIWKQDLNVVSMPSQILLVT